MSLASPPKTRVVGLPLAATPRAPQSGTTFNSNMVLACAIAVYVGLLQFSFQVLIAPTNEYRGGFVYRTPEVLPYALSIAIVIVLAWTMPKNIDHLSHFVLWVLFLGAAAPAILAGNYIDVVPVNDAFVLGVNIAVCLLIVRVAAEIRPALNLGGTLSGLSRFFPAACLAITATVLAYLAFQGTLSFRFLSLSDVYDVRSEFRLAGEGNLIAGYIVPAQFYVIGPTVIAFGLLYRRWPWTLVGVVSQLILYATVGHKTVLFSVLAVFGVFALLRKWPSWGNSFARRSDRGWGTFRRDRRRDRRQAIDRDLHSALFSHAGSSCAGLSQGVRE